MKNEDEKSSRLWAIVPVVESDANVEIIRAAIESGAETVVVFPAKGLVMLPLLIIALVMSASAAQILAIGASVAMITQPGSVKQWVTKIITKLIG